ncbi:MAG: hypothetical protein KKH41_02560 [Candidatus Thermoplasmatota archaeon]|nr:hypothetical protein [Euryarchaeota archaeon]MBU4032891.1 hypothetical protein [Candidatus Thermoplasmatota archaeon]MBU4071941.1 hypothetical protein [Candidatus Thermoplasmatota archaeon]MBU4143464.1 hypothetical protein [Candidatus Thermoplasmatota archaeon]MBU4591445.1 hypothetical protein [Candidatus Thermoplasmatota archaeon]
MVIEKTIDFKFITIFRILFCSLTILTFLMPWTYSQEVPGGLDQLGYFHTDTGITKSGYDYMVGCTPIKDIDIFIQMPYLIFTPILLIFSVALMFFNNKNRLLGSMALILFSAIPMLIWRFEIDSLIPLPSRTYFFLTYGLVVYLILVIMNMILGLVTLKFSDIE